MVDPGTTGAEDPAGGGARAPDDLGFTCRRRKDGAVEVLHHGRLAATLRSAAAEKFWSSLPTLSPADAQLRMARLTGNYRRGNERQATGHARNRR